MPKGSRRGVRTQIILSQEQYDELHRLSKFHGDFSSLVRSGVDRELLAQRTDSRRNNLYIEVEETKEKGS